MKKLSIISAIAILIGGLSFANPVYQSAPAQTGADKKPAAPATGGTKKSETKKEVKKVPVRKTVTKKSDTKAAAAATHKAE